MNAGFDGTQGAKADQPFIDALRAEFARKTLPAESPQAALDQLSKDKDKREAHNQNILNRVSVAAAPARATNPSDALRQTLHNLVEASGSSATPAAADASFVAALRPEVRTRENETRTIVVQAGDTLSAISQRAYGDPAKFMKIFEANPRVLTSPHQLFIGMVLRVPA